VATELRVIRTSGDERPHRPEKGETGKGLFTKEIEDALLDGSLDLAVHSLKDLLVEFPDGLTLAAVPERADARDALVTRDGRSLEAVPSGAAIGSSSTRRQAALRAARRDLRVVPLRGNVPTRYRRIQEGAVDGAVMALAGLTRLGLTQGAVPLDPMVFVPAPGQGAIAVEARKDDSRVLDALHTLDDLEIRTCVQAERGVLARLESGCNVPVGAHCVGQGGAFELHAAVYAVDGSRTIRASRAVDAGDPMASGTAVAERLLAEGAGELIALAASAEP
jgi:hydroxymethylbilane synthase